MGHEFLIQEDLLLHFAHFTFHNLQNKLYYTPNSACLIKDTYMYMMKECGGEKRKEKDGRYS
jgi:hypothetical protein